MRTGAHSGSEIAPELRITAVLPDDSRRVVTLSKVNGLRPDVIAARLGFTPRAVDHHCVTAALAGCAGACSCADLTDHVRKTHRGARP